MFFNNNRRKKVKKVKEKHPKFKIREKKLEKHQNFVLNIKVRFLRHFDVIRCF